MLIDLVLISLGIFLITYVLFYKGLINNESLARYELLIYYSVFISAICLTYVTISMYFNMYLSLGTYIPSFSLAMALYLISLTVLFVKAPKAKLIYSLVLSLITPLLLYIILPNIKVLMTFFIVLAVSLIISLILK